MRKFKDKLENYVLAIDARDEYNRRMAGKTRKDIPAFEDYVFALCEVAKELRQQKHYSKWNTLPSDSTLQYWRWTLQKALS